MKLQSAKNCCGVLLTVPIVLGTFLNPLNALKEQIVGSEIFKQFFVTKISNKASVCVGGHPLNHNFGLESATDLILVSIPRLWGMGNHLGPLSDTSD